MIQSSQQSQPQQNFNRYCYVWLTFTTNILPILIDCPYKVQFKQHQHLTIGQYNGTQQLANNIHKKILDFLEYGQCEFFTAGYECFTRNDSDVIYMRIRSKSKLINKDIVRYCKKQIIKSAEIIKKHENIPHITLAYVPPGQGKKICSYLKKSFVCTQIKPDNLYTKVELPLKDLPEYKQKYPFLKTIFRKYSVIIKRFYKRSDECVKYWNDYWGVQLTKNQCWYLDLSLTQYEFQTFIMHDWKMIEMIDLYGCKIGKQIQDFLQFGDNFINLKVIQLGYTELTDNQWKILCQQISSFLSLVYLTLNGNQIRNIQIGQLQQLQDKSILKVIRLKNNPLTDVSIKNINKYLNRNDLGDLGIKIYPFLADLKKQNQSEWIFT